MAVGAGAALQVAREMARMRREMMRWRADRAARRDAMRDRLARLGSTAPVVERAAFPCFDLCGECGYITREARGDCPGCGNSSWMDLAHEPTADAVRDLEAANRMKTPTWVKATAAGSIAGSFTALVAATGVAPWAVGAALVGIPVGYVIGLRPLSVLLQRLTPRDRPHRWHLPLPFPEGRLEPEARLRGDAQAAGELIHAPFSGRPCIAYSATILFDTQGDARPAEWVLQEVAAADLEIGEHRIPGARVMPNGPIVPVTADMVRDDLDLPHFLRERGLFHTDGEFELFEVLIEPGDAIEACVFYGRTTAALVHPAPADT